MMGLFSGGIVYSDGIVQWWCPMMRLNCGGTL